MTPRSAPLLPLRDIIVFPHQVVPLFVGRDRSIAAVESADTQGRELILSAQKRAKTNDPVPDDIYRVGTLANIIQPLSLPDGTVKVLVEGRQRVRIVRWLSNDPHFVVEYVPLNDERTDVVDLETRISAIQTTFENFVKLNKRVPPDTLAMVTNIADPSRLADSIVTYLNLKLSDKQDLLEINSPFVRLARLKQLIESEIEILQVERKIRTRVKRQMERTQKEYYLNEQMQAIQKELGERDEFKNELQELEDRIDEKLLSTEADARCRQELKKLRMMSPMSAEATVLRNYLDWVLALPWASFSEDQLCLKDAELVLDEDHYGLVKVKERILEHLAVQVLVDKPKGPILCLVGAPGVGKTSLARSVARSMSRQFVRMSLGGVRDEAEIRGHRRTYIGAMPGKILQSLKRAGTSNPVFLLDEVDKMSADFRGDPSSALLEVLDPEQNSTFADHYLDLDYDLSHILFLATANTTASIPEPLKDRMEIIRLEGYTELEKLAIAKKYLIPKQREATGLSAKNIQFTDASIRYLCRRYTREAGVRSLDRHIASLCRKIARSVVTQGDDHMARMTEKRIEARLGKPRYPHLRTEEHDEIGLATGLAWTPAGGELLLTEVSVLPGKGKLILTGKLGEVMRESAHAAMSYVRSRADRLGIDRSFYAKVDIHVHVPDGAMPKDGPSAGITIATALTSALTGLPVRRDIAMTGEITLRGRVLPVGGLKEKSIAAHREAMRTVLLPQDNIADLEDIPESIQQAIKLIPISHVDEVLKHALVLEDPDSFFLRLQGSLTEPSSSITSQPGISH
ncbi:MAG: endopeptidase La [Myxococcales bacterium]|nr:endopeptidase La [Myxococcales bacterium]